MTEATFIEWIGYLMMAFGGAIVLLCLYAAYRNVPCWDGGVEMPPVLPTANDEYWANRERADREIAERDILMYGFALPRTIESIAEWRAYRKRIKHLNRHIRRTKLFPNFKRVPR